MAQLTQDDTERTQAGNTKIRLRNRGWFLTINNYSPEDEANIDNIGADKYIWQEEVGNSGTPHLQVFLYFINPVDFNTVKRWFPAAHIEKAQSNSESIKYCSKESTRIRGPFIKNIELPKTICIIQEFKEWQKKILDLIDTEPDYRTIYWYYDEVGNTGKTSLCKYICSTRQDAIYVNGSAKDMKYAITCMKIKPRVILIDYARDQESHISWQGIEEIKNGIFFNSKYESSMVIYNSPHVICFANFKPQEYKLSKDRWNILDVNEPRIKVDPLDAIFE